MRAPTFMADILRQVRRNVAYAATMPPKTTRRELLGLVPIVAALTGVALAPAYLRTFDGQRFTMELARELPKSQRATELDLAIERMHETLGLVCGPATSVRRIGEHIVFGVSGHDDYSNRELAEMLLEVAEPVELRITAVERGIVDVSFARERLPFHERLPYWSDIMPG
jgi:hypothetical protein